MFCSQGIQLVYIHNTKHLGMAICCDVAKGGQRPAAEFGVVGVLAAGAQQQLAVLDADFEGAETFEDQRLQGPAVTGTAHCRKVGAVLQLQGVWACKHTIGQLLALQQGLE